MNLRCIIILRYDVFYERLIMNKISLISLALSFLFTLTSGCVHSSDSEESSSVSATEQASSDSASEANADDSEKKASEKKTTKKRKRNKNRKRSKSVGHYSSGHSRVNLDRANGYTTNNNKQVLSEEQSTESAK